MSKSFLLMLTVEQAAEMLGLRESTIRAWVLRRKITYHKVGGRAVRIPQAEVERILEESRVPTRTA